MSYSRGMGIIAGWVAASLILWWLIWLALAWALRVAL